MIGIIVFLAVCVFFWQWGRNMEAARKVEQQMLREEREAEHAEFMWEQEWNTRRAPHVTLLDLEREIGAYRGRS